MATNPPPSTPPAVSLLLRECDRSDLLNDLRVCVREEIEEALRRRPQAVEGEEMASIAGISRTSLDRLRKAGKVPSAKVGTRRLYDPDAVMAALMKGQSDTAA